MDREKIILSRHRTCKPALAEQSNFSRRNLIQVCLKKNGSSMVKQTKLFALPKFGSLRGSTSASVKIGENLAIRKKLASFWNWGSHLFYVTWWQIYYLCKQNWLKFALVRPGPYSMTAVRFLLIERCLKILSYYLQSALTAVACCFVY